MKLFLTTLVLCLFAACGEGDQLPADPNATVPQWPAEGKCNWYNLGMSGGCDKWVELCTVAGQHCTTYVVCRQAYPQGCTK